MRTTLFLLPSLLAACAYVPQSPQKPGTTDAHLAHAKPAPMPADLDAHGFAALEAMTFDCPKAGLNAAAREAAKVPSQGTYQFSYFNLVSDAHHSLYEVHFKSNAAGEPLLRYCVSIYCQQGWDPRTTQVHVRSMSAVPARNAARADACTAAPGRKKQASP